MEVKNVLRIRKNFDKICENLLVDYIKTLLIEKGILTHIDIELICKERTEKEKAYRLLLYVLQLSNQEYDAFRNCLMQDHDWLVQALDDTEITDEEIEQERRALSSNLGGLIPCYTGRKNEENNIVITIRKNSSKPIAITGLAGVGKSTVAIAVAHRLSDHNFRIAFISLRNTSTLTTVPQNILYQLNISAPDFTEKLDDNMACVCLLLRRIRSSILVVFDNAEDVLADELYIQFMNIIQKLAGVPNVYILITSRVKLHSTSVIIEDMPLVALLEDDCAQLLKSLVPNIPASDINPVSSACGGLPLALTMVAAILKSGIVRAEHLISDLEKSLLSNTTRAAGSIKPDETLHHCILSSYEHLTEDEKMLFRKLSIFPNTFDSEAANALASDSNQTQIVLSSLVNRSMCSYDQSTQLFSLHPLLKYFASQKLKEGSEENETVRKFTDFEVQKIVQLTERYYSTEWKSSITEVKRDQTNIEHCLQLLSQNLDLATCKLLGPCHVFRFLYEFIDRSEILSFYKAVAGRENSGDQKYKAPFLYSLADIAMRENTQEALDYFRQIENVLGQKLTKTSVSDVAFICYQTRYAKALIVSGQREKTVSFLQSVSIPDANSSMSTEEKYLIFQSHYNISGAYQAFDDHEKSLENLVTAKSVIDHHMCLGAHTVNVIVGINTAVELITLNRVDEAKVRLDEAIEMCIESNQQKSMLMVRALNNMAKCLLSNQDYTQAVTKCREGLEIMEDLGLESTVRHSELMHTLGKIQFTLHNYTDATAVFEKAAAASANLGRLRNLSDNLEWKGNALKEQRNFQEAREAYSGALAVAKQTVNKKQMKVLYEDLRDVHTELGDNTEANDCERKIRQLEKSEQVKETGEQTHCCSKCCQCKCILL